MRSHLAAVVLAGTTLLADDVLAQAPPERASYTFFRNGAPVGRHTVDISTQGNRRSVSASTQQAVQLLDRVVVYRYSHRATETWDGDRLVSMETQTDDNGNVFRVTVSTSGGSLVVRSLAPETEAGGMADRMMGFQPSAPKKTVEQVLPGSTLPTSWWNRRVVEQSRLLN